MRLIVILLLSFVTTHIQAQKLQQFTFLGKLSDVNENFSGSKKIEYTIYDLNDILWRETHKNVAITKGNCILPYAQSFAFILQSRWRFNIIRNYARF